MFYRVLYFVGGIAFIGLGYDVLIEGGWWSTKGGIFIEYGENEWAYRSFKNCYRDFFSHLLGHWPI